MGYGKKSKKVRRKRLVEKNQRRSNKWILKVELKQ